MSLATLGRTRQTNPLRHPRAADVAVGLGALSLAALLPVMLQQRPTFAMAAALGLAALIGGLMFRPSLVSLIFAWLVVAPFLQEPARSSGIGHQLQYVLYELPPLVFLGWSWWLRGHRRGLVRPTAVDLLPVLLFAFAAASVLLSSNPDADSFARLRDLFWNVGLGVVVYYVVAFAPLTRAALESITLALLMTTTLAGVVAISQYVAGYSIWNSGPLGGSGAPAAPGTLVNQGVASAIGTLGSPAVLGTVTGVGAVVAISLLTWDGPVRWRRLARLSLPITLTATLLSFERAPIGATVGVALLIVIARRRIRLRALAVLLLLSVTAVVLIPHLTPAAVYQKRATNAAGLGVRLQVAQRSLQLARLSPVVGNGYGNYEAVSRERTLATSTFDIVGARGVTSHNTLLTMLVEVGLVGIALALVHWIWVVAGALRALRGGQLPTWLGAAWLAAAGVVVVDAMAIDLRFFSFVCVVPWLCFGLLRRFRPAG